MYWIGPFRRCLGIPLQANSFLLCLCSPVLHKLICGSFTEGGRRRFELQEVSGSAFRDVLDVWCGADLGSERDVCRAMELGAVADRFQMTDVVSALEDAILRHLGVDTCADVLGRAGGAWLDRPREAARGLALGQFEAVAATAGFLRLDEATLGDLLEDDGLVAPAEDAVL